VPPSAPELLVLGEMPGYEGRRGELLDVMLEHRDPNRRHLALGVPDVLGAVRVQSRRHERLAAAGAELYELLLAVGVAVLPGLGALGDIPPVRVRRVRVAAGAGGFQEPPC
jgi:hypothetical protein